eukprot:79591_1
MATTKRLKCLCGYELKRYTSPGSRVCTNCSQWFDSGTTFFACFDQGTCDFDRVTGLQYRVCCECFENIPSHQTLEQRLSFALQTTKSTIQQKTQAQAPINTYLCELNDTGGIYLTIDGYLKH